jgi:hypothetical protein
MQLPRSGIYLDTLLTVFGWNPMFIGLLSEAELVQCRIEYVEINGGGCHVLNVNLNK